MADRSQTQDPSKIIAHAIAAVHPGLTYVEDMHRRAEKALQALEAAGLLIVPLDPTGEMIQAGADCAFWNTELNSQLDREALAKLQYRAMLAARPR